jgi:hypothetical protein
MKKFTRRALFTAAAPAIAAAAFIPSSLGGSRPGARRPTEIINFYSTAKAPLDIKPDQLIDVMQTYVDQYLGPVWGVSAKLNWSNKAQDGAWNCVFVDSHQNDVADAIAYHEMNNSANAPPPDALVDIEKALEVDGSVAGAVTHELAEMLVDPGCSYWASPIGFNSQPDKSTPAANSQLYAFEVCDPVQDAHFKIDGVIVSDFVFPAYFEPWRDNGPIDYMGVLSRPGEIADGGYQIVRDHEQLTDLTSDGPDGPDTYRCYRFKKIWRRLRAQGYKVR